MNYTEEERSIINKAWFLLERIVETNNSAEYCLDKAIENERKIRKDISNAKALILREVYNYNKIKKHEIFGYSENIAKCIVMALYIFHNPHPELLKQIKDFKLLTRKAIKAHQQYMERLYALHSI